MSDMSDFDFSQIELPTINTSGIIKRMNAMNAAVNDSLEAAAEHNRKKDEALFQTAEASIAQRKLLEQQLNEVREQNQQLRENNALLKELYKSAKKDSDSNAEDAKKNMHLAWTSIVIGTVIGIAGVVVGIIF